MIPLLEMEHSQKLWINQKLVLLLNSRNLLEDYFTVKLYYTIDTVGNIVETIIPSRLRNVVKIECDLTRHQYGLCTKGGGQRKMVLNSW